MSIRDDATRDFRDLQRETPVAAAKIDHLHSMGEVDRGDDRCRIVPQRLPPAGSRHFGALEEFG
jgi:hypothetical protein